MFYKAKKRIMSIEEFQKKMSEREYVSVDSELSIMFHQLAQEAIKITTKINSKYHSQKELRKLFSKLTGRKTPETFCLFPPFYTECGKNITIGENVFINACCKFQDQGGITIGDGCFLGHNVTIATLNHELNPKYRANIVPNSVQIGKNVWIGSNSIILSGVEIGDGAVVGAGSVVTKNVPENIVVIGNSAKVIKKIDA